MSDNPGERPGLYIHIPFCLSKCVYCDFYSITGLSWAAQWLAAVDREAACYQGRFGTFDTLYLGGGTPSLLEAGQLEALLAGLRRRLAFAPDTEVTLEANPDDLSGEKLRAYRDLGINRLSVGVQSFADRELAFLGRRHNARQTIEVLEEARAAGFDNLSLDLIYALPGQTLADWTRSLEQALAFQPEHLSCYQLTYAPDTPLGRRQARGELTPATEEEERAFFLCTSRFLAERGYLHYEISNFARLGGPGNLPNCQVINDQVSFHPKPKTQNPKPCYSRHNRKYWQHVPYLGLGPGAHSFRDGVRWWNIAGVEPYCRSLARGQAPVEGREVLTEEQLWLEALYLGLRTAEGVALDLLRRSPGWEKVLIRLQKAGLLQVVADRSLPTREGFLVADRLALGFAGGGTEGQGCPAAREPGANGAGPAANP